MAIANDAPNRRRQGRSNINSPLLPTLRSSKKIPTAKNARTNQFPGRGARVQNDEILVGQLVVFLVDPPDVIRFDREPPPTSPSSTVAKSPGHSISALACWRQLTSDRRASLRRKIPISAPPKVHANAVTLICIAFMFSDYFGCTYLICVFSMVPLKANGASSK